MTYAYRCYSQNRTGTVSARLKRGLSIEGVCPVPIVQDWKLYTMAQKVFHTIFDDREKTIWEAEALLGKSISEVVQSDLLQDKTSVEEQLRQEQGRYDVLLEMRMNNEIPKEVFYRKQMEVERKIAELEQQLLQFQDVKAATEEDVSTKRKDLKKLLEQGLVLENGEFTEADIDKYVYGIRVYEDHFEWMLNLKTDAGGELDSMGSPVYFTTITVTPDDERAWFKAHTQWSKSNKYAELEVRIYI